MIAGGQDQILSQGAQCPSPPVLRRRSMAAICALLCVASCSPGSDLPPLPDAAKGPYRLDAGDQVRVITFGEESLTGGFRISDSGTIAIPLLGPIPARGLTTAELETKIAGELKAKNLIKEPSVSVEIVNYRPIFVLGEINRPGQYPYQPGMTVLTAVAVAGGFTYRAVENYASILRTVRGRSVEGRVGRGAYVEPGDVITIFERRL